jgi:hypothetical protein
MRAAMPIAPFPPAALVAPFVTAHRRATTHCHHNFGYYLSKHKIPRCEDGRRNGTRDALKSKLVYT